MCSNSFRIITMLIFALLAFITNLFIPNIPVLVWYFANASIFSFILFAIDKLNAKKDRIRVPENSFHFLSLIGGTIGVMLGIILLRHKLGNKGFLAIQFAIFIVYLIIAFFVIKNYSAILGI
ncbi:MAG: DUF1294 domain-containing protein [Sulfurospirillaceae bacterium]|nr:DUF1294 domain-containing protein [Sulfurospirillaceae bacterium]